MSDPRRRVPRTDTVLAAERRVATSGRLVVDTVKRSARAAQDRVRVSKIAPEDVVDAVRMPGESRSVCSTVAATPTAWIPTAQRSDEGTDGLYERATC